MNILSWIILGSIAGAIARILPPRHQSGGIVSTIFIGIIGAFVGGTLYTLLTTGTLAVTSVGLSIGGLIIAVIGAWLALYVQSLALKSPSSQPSSSKQTVSKYSSINIVETIRSEEPVGEEQRAIDNSGSAINLTRRFTVSKEWSQSYTVQYERVRSSGGEFNLGIADKAGIKLTIQEALKSQYSISDETRRAYAEEVVLEIPAKTRLRVFFHWKRIWQHGIIKLRDQRNREIEIPFQVVIGLTFDQTQVDDK